MDWLYLLSSAGIGALLALLAKELIDYLRAEKSHRNELQRKYFDAKLDATIRIIRQMKTGTSNLKAFVKLVKENEETNGWIQPTLIGAVGQSWSESVQRVNEEAAGVSALLGFYYDDELAKLVESGSGAPTPLLQKLSEFMGRLEAITNARNVLASEAPAEMKDTAEKIIALNEQELRANINEMDKLAQTLDDLSDQVVKKMRESYHGIRF